MNGRATLAVLLCALVVCSRLHAMPYAVPETWGGALASRPRLTGSWGGVRDDMAQKGVVLDLDLYWFGQKITGGGKERGGSGWGQAIAALQR